MSEFQPSKKSLIEQLERCAIAAIRVAFIDFYGHSPTPDDESRIERYRLVKPDRVIPMADADDVFPPCFIRFKNDELGVLRLKRIVVDYIGNERVGYSAKVTPVVIGGNGQPVAEVNQ